jgi:hypothetical protein
MSAMRTGVLAVVGGLLAAVCLASIASAQTTWMRTYGGSEEDQGASVQQTADGGFIIAGYTHSFGVEWFDVYLIKTNAQGDTLWTRTYGGSEAEAASCVQQTTDGGYIAVGYTYTFGPGAPGYYANVYLIKTDSLGDTLWTRAYGGSKEDDRGLSVAQTSDGGYIAVGWTECFGPDWIDLYLIKTDAQGDTLWTRVFGGADVNEGCSVQQTWDGGYIIAGRGGSGSGAWLIKTGAQGGVVWTRNYAGRGTGNSVLQTTDGGYLLAGGSDRVPYGDYDVYLVKTDSLGDTLWTRAYGGVEYDGAASVEQTTDGGYIVVGYTYSFGVVHPYRYADVYLIRTDAQGDTLWTRTYGGTRDDGGNSVQPTADGGCVVAGTTNSFGAGGYDFYLIRTRGELDIGPVAIESPSGIAESGSAYVPRAVIRNFGLTSGIVPIIMEIGFDYVRTVKETLVSVPYDTVVFPAWTAGPVGTVPVKCFTWMAGDQDRTNDTISSSIQVGAPPRHDVGAVAIISPSGSVRAGDAVTPKARIRNFGNAQERFFDVRLRIGTSYNEKVNVSDALPPDSMAELTFPPWVATAGDWAVACSTVLASDVDLTNDKAISSVQVLPQTLAIGPDQSDRLEAGKSKTYRFHALIAGDMGGVVAVARPTALTGWSLRLRDADGEDDLTDTDSDGIPDLGNVAPGESGWFSLDVTAPSELRGDTASLSLVTALVAGHVSDRPDIADTAMLTLTLVPELSIHNFPNPFTDHTSFVIGLPEDGKASLTIYTRDGARVCRVLANADLPAGVHLVPWDGVNDNGRDIAPGTYEYLLDYVHGGKTARIRKKLVLTRQ